MALDDTTRQLVDGKNFATIATLNPDGSPQTSVIWVGLDGDQSASPDFYAWVPSRRRWGYRGGLWLGAITVP
jgi:hypothetical protein